ncbi:MAG TPA: hypothetical protein VMT16_05440 [Thermoanaerobaculia bacterium]|nr:hypothetical protein [Thermoanaerobaculia bacterium]
MTSAHRADRPPSRRPTLREVVGAIFLLLQVGFIVRARFDPDRYFCWAPHDAQNEYLVEAVVGGRTLRPGEIAARYRMAQRGVDPRAIEHVFDVIRHYEGRVAAEPAAVVVRYRTNGGEPRVWRWPESPAR